MEGKMRDDLQVVVFYLGKEEYALPIMKVQEINKIEQLTKMPHTPDFMEGIIKLRGQIIPVIDMKKRFKMKVSAETENSRIVVVDFKGQIVGLMVDGVAEVVHLEHENIEAPPAVSKLDTQYVKGLGKKDGRLLVLLDIDGLFTGKEADDLKKTNG